MTRRQIRLLTFSTLYPHAGRPNHGIFVENRLRHLVSGGEVTSTVIAPVPWFPSRAPRFGDWASNARAERRECRHGIDVYHPRYPLVPRWGMSIAPVSLAGAGILQVKKLLRAGLEFDAVDAHYVYPDGVAAVLLGAYFGKPVVLTARGSDITQYPDFRIPRRMIRSAMDRAAALISVSSGLKDAMVALGAAKQKITVLRNGVDLEAFQPRDRAVVRSTWGIERPLMLSVGHLIQRKGHDLAIRALLGLPEWHLAIVGEGPERQALHRLTAELGLAERVTFCGVQPHSSLADFYSAADVLVLASSREGWANVLLEAMACGTPVVASNIPGNPEVVQEAVAGEVVSENTAACFAETIERVYAAKESTSSVRAYAEQFSWDATSRGQIELFRRVLNDAA